MTIHEEWRGALLLVSREGEGDQLWEIMKLLLGQLNIRNVKTGKMNFYIPEYELCASRAIALQSHYTFQ